MHVKETTHITRIAKTEHKIWTCRIPSTAGSDAKITQESVRACMDHSFTNENAHTCVRACMDHSSTNNMLQSCECICKLEVTSKYLGRIDTELDSKSFCKRFEVSSAIGCASLQECDTFDIEIRSASDMSISCLQAFAVAHAFERLSYLIQNDGSGWIVWDTNVSCVRMLPGQQCDGATPSNIKCLPIKFE